MTHPTRQPASLAGSRRPRRWLPPVLLALLLGLVLLPLRAGPHSWRPLAGEHGPAGRIRWVVTSTDPLLLPPTAPGWVRALHARGLPWPTDLPLEPPGAAFGGAGGGPGAAAWYLVESLHDSDELWRLDKPSLEMTDAAGHPVPPPGGAGAVRVEGRPGRQLLYVGVPEPARGKGRLRLRLLRGRHEATSVVELPY